MSHKKQILLISTLVSSFFFCFWSTIEGLSGIWMSEGDYSYASLIPFISIYIVWERKKEISANMISPNWYASLAFLFFMVISTYGILGSSPSAVRPAIPFVILTAVLFCFGNRLFKVLFFPLFLLFFMIPLPTSVQTWVGVPLKLVSTRLGEIMLRIFGIPVFVEGNIIDLGITQLEVVDACSGLRYLLPLFAIGVVFVYFFEKVRWKQSVIVLFTVPLSIFTNGFRIGITGVLTQWYDPKVAEGFFHSFSGWFLFMFAFVMLFLFHYVLKKIFKNNPSPPLLDMKSAQAPDDCISRNNELPVMLSSLVLVLLGLLSSSTSAMPGMSLAGGFSEFPLSIGHWKGEHSRLIARDIIEKSGAEDVFNATYNHEDGNSISLYIGYRGSPFLESENFFHSPNVCIPSSGWKVLFTKKHYIQGVPNFANLAVSEMLIEKMGYRQLVYFWFQTKNKASHNVNINRYHLSMHAISRDNTYDLFIRPITPIGTNEELEDAEKRMDQFTKKMMPELLQFLNRQQVVSQPVYSQTDEVG